MAELDVGALAPDFTIEGDDGTAISLKDFAGRKLVVYFYPKDDTPACTQEAIDFTRAASEFQKVDTAILGVSKDSVAKHAKFKTKHSLGVALGSDPDGTMVEAYGVWGPKTLYGRMFMGIERMTVLVGRDGKVARVWRKVRVSGHVDEVQKAAQALG